MGGGLNLDLDLHLDLNLSLRLNLDLNLGQAWLGTRKSAFWIRSRIEGLLPVCMDGVYMVWFGVWMADGGRWMVDGGWSWSSTCSQLVVDVVLFGFGSVQFQFRFRFQNPS